MHSDILGKTAATSWLVTGWFTEDYSPLARRLSDNLDRLAVPHHFYAREKDPRGYVANTRRKPEVVLAAFSDYPGKTVVLFDVDMEVLGDISSLAAINGDVIVASNTKPGDCVPWKKRKRRIHMGSRVMVWKSNEPAKQLARLWLEQCQKPGISYGDEVAFIEAYVRSEGVALSRLPPRYAGVQKHTAPQGAVVIHDSEYDKRKTLLQKLISGKLFRN